MTEMEVESVTVIGGQGKDGGEEPVDEVTLEMGDVVSIVGPTGSGKTVLINDVEFFADRNTPSGRRILINGEPPPSEFKENPSRNPVALITQHTNFLSDLPVQEFLEAHAKIRHSEGAGDVVEETLEFANQLTGEDIILDNAMTELSGGQTRSLLIADAAVIGHAPIILLDEIENAGIHRTKAIELLREYEKIFVFVTHELSIILSSDFRIAMSNGAMQDVIETGPEERRVAERIRGLDDGLMEIRGLLRRGEKLTEEDFARHVGGP